MKNSTLNSIQEIYKYKIIWRIAVSVGAFGIICFGVYYLYEIMVQVRIDFFDIGVAIALIIFGNVLIYSYNYFRLVLTETSLTQEGRFFKRTVMFDNSLVLKDNGNGSFLICDNSQEVRISSDIERTPELIEKLRSTNRYFPSGQ